MILDILNAWFDGLCKDSTRPDSTYEEDVKQRCDHEFETSKELIDWVNLNEARVEDERLVVPQMRKVTEYCTNCGKPGLHGEVIEPINRPFAEPSGEYTEIASLLVFEPMTIMDPDGTVARPNSDEGSSVTITECEFDYEVTD